MKRYDDDTYGESISEIYDSTYSDFDRRMIDCLFDFANDGKVLELGIGTGRVAIPLKERGIQIHGIDTSRSMVSKLKKKTNEEIPVIIQSFAEFKFDDQYDLVFVVFNTFFALLTQNEQVSCLKSVANALLQGGRFVIEAFVPDLGRFDRGQSTRTTNLSSNSIVLESSRHDLATQIVTSQISYMSPKGIKMYPIKIRYAWPSEIDLMAQLAGLTLESRWSDWNKSVFTSQSEQHISTYKKV